MTRLIRTIPHLPLLVHSRPLPCLICALFERQQPKNAYLVMKQMLLHFSSPVSLHCGNCDTLVVSHHMLIPGMPGSEVKTRVIRPVASCSVVKNLCVCVYKLTYVYLV